MSTTAHLSLLIAPTLAANTVLLRLRPQPILDVKEISAGSLYAEPEQECDLVKDAHASAPSFTLEQAGFRVPARSIEPRRCA